MRAVVLTALVLALAGTGSSQIRQFKFEGGLCEYTGTYNSRKFAADELANTFSLVSAAGSVPLHTWNTVFIPEDIAKLNPAALEREYKTKLAKLKTMKIVKVPYFEELRQRSIKALETYYRLESVQTRAYKDPKAMLEFADAPACTAKYAHSIIAGGDELKSVWRMVNEDSRSRNANPEALRLRFERESGAPDWMRYALVETITFGWGNCANGAVPFVKDDGTPISQFKKLFTRVRQRCEEP